MSFSNVSITTTGLSFGGSGFGVISTTRILDKTNSYFTYEIQTTGSANNVVARVFYIAIGY